MRIFYIILYSIVTMLPVQGNDPLRKNLIRNGSFEEGNLYFSSDLTYDSIEVSPGKFAVTDDASKLNPTFIQLAGHTSGTDYYFVADPAGNENEKIWCAEVNVVPQAEYEFSVWMSIVHQSHDNAPQIIFTVNGNKVGASASLKNQDWVQYTWRWHSGTASGNVSLCLVNDVLTPSGNDLAIDDVEFFSLNLPEPAVIKPPVGDTLPMKVHFPFEEAGITDFSKQKLESLLLILNKYPEMNIKILAHTDMFGAHDFNNQLSEKRAKVIFEYLVSNHIQEKRLQMEWYGEKKIIYNGRSAKDNVKNRRVEFVISGYTP